MSSQVRSKKSAVTSRRSFLKTSAVVGAAATVPSFTMRAAANNNSKLRILHIGVGGIGGLQRSKLKNHPKAEFGFLCDVDSKNLIVWPGNCPRPRR